jgi:hypothetical protein
MLQPLRKRPGKGLVWFRKNLWPERALPRRHNSAMDDVADIGTLAVAPLNAGTTILVRDGSIARETDESIAGEWFHKAAVHLVEINFGATVTAAEVQAAVREATARAPGSGEKVAADAAVPGEEISCA